VVVAICLAVGVGGCAHARAPRVAASPAPVALAAADDAPDGVETLLRYDELLRFMTPQALNDEYARIAGKLAGDPSAPNRLRAALLLGRPGTMFHDPARAQELLRLVLNDPATNARTYRPLASFQLAILRDREQIESSLADERKQRQKLEQQLDQLKAIEKEFGNRPPPKPLPDSTKAP
jgi:hypothetical protein